MYNLIQEAILANLREVNENTLLRKAKQLGTTISRDYLVKDDYDLNDPEVPGRIAMNKLRYWDAMLSKGLLQGDDKQLDKIKTFDQLLDILEKNKDTRSHQEKKSEVFRGNARNAELVFENDKVRVIVPKDREASCLLGKGTKWCISATKDNRWEAYQTMHRGKATFYFILPKASYTPFVPMISHSQSGKFVIGVQPDGKIFTTRDAMDMNLLDNEPDQMLAYYDIPDNIFISRNLA